MDPVPGNLIVGNFVLTEMDIQKLEAFGPMDSEELNSILRQYSQPESTIHDLSGRTFSDSELWRIQIDDGIIIEPDSQKLYESGSKFRVVGVTEKWIPIEGKVTKVLHLELAQ